MENTENNEVIVEVTEEVIRNAGMNKAVKIVAGTGVAVVGGYVIYKYVAKPVIAKIKAKCDQRKNATDNKTVYVHYEEVDNAEEN